MRKPSKKWLTSVASLTILSIGLTFGVGASELIYDDENVSISTAVDRYIASNTDSPIEEATSKDAVEESHVQVGSKSALEKEVVTAANTDKDTNESKSSAKYPEYENMALVKINDSVNIREKGSIDSKKVAVIGPKGILLVKEKGSEWSYVISGNCAGYIKNEFLAFGDDAGAYAKANNIDINVDTVVAQPVSGISTNATANEASSNASSSSSSSAGSQSSSSESYATPSGCSGNDVANYAVQFQGNPYVYGGTSLTNGADCSGFVYRVYADFGISLPRTAGSQAGVGTPVDISAVQPGDLIFYDHGTGSVEHVGIYIGNGQIIHASTSRTGIIVADMNYSTPFSAVRIIN